MVRIEEEQSEQFGNKPFQKGFLKLKKHPEPHTWLEVYVVLLTVNSANWQTCTPPWHYGHYWCKLNGSGLISVLLL